MGKVKKTTTSSKTAKAKKTKKSKSNETENLEATGMLNPVRDVAMSLELVPLSRTDIIRRLTEKLSHFDANIIFDAAVTSVGLTVSSDGQLNKEEARQICLALIKRGGPAYAVGAGLYREMLG